MPTRGLGRAGAPGDPATPRPEPAAAVPTMPLSRQGWTVAIDLVRWDGDQALAFALAKALLYGRRNEPEQARLWALIARTVEEILSPQGDQAAH
jgi:hypothetical protein